MCVNAVASVFVVCLLVQTCAADVAGRLPPRVDKPVLLDSFIPASMQIMAHLTELMKYDLKPTTKPPYGTGTTTTSTMKPTPAHRPGIYAPAKPPGPQAFYSQKDFNYREYVERLQQPSGYNYFDRYGYPLASEQQTNHQITPSDVQGRSYPSTGGLASKFADEEPVNYELYFGKDFANVVELVRRIEPDIVPNDVDLQVQQFSREYDDSNFRYEQFRQKKVPPTKAYVTLLSLYDLLNKESKKLGLNKYQGYSDKVLQELVKSSMGTSAHQLKTVMSKIVERGDTRKPDIVKKITQLVADLDEQGSYINEALRDIPPLAFVL